MTAIRVCSPAKCSPEMFDKFCALVLEGGQVLESGLADRVRRAAFLAFAQDGEELVGVAALKNPDPAYRAGVFSKAQGGIAADFR